MKMLKKLALVSAISAISVSAFAMEAMDDETMSATTGQDGITINIVPDAISYAQAASMGVSDTTMAKISGIGGYPAAGFKGLSIGEIRVHDDDGLGTLGSSATANSGALVIGGGADGANAAAVKADRTVILAKGDKPIQINVDMVGDADSVTAGNQAMLNVEIKQPKMAIKLGNIYVANSNAAQADWNEDGTSNAGGAEVDGTTVTDKVKIMSGLEIVLAESTMTIQLGNESQGSMIKADANLVGGLTINNFELFDQDSAPDLNADSLLTGAVGSGGSIRAKSISILDNGAATDGTGVLTTQTSIDVGSRATVGSTVSVTTRDANFTAVFNALNANPSTATVFTNLGLAASSTDADVTTALSTATTNASTAARALTTANINLANANTSLASANASLDTQRDTTAATLFGSTYAALGAVDKATVDTDTAVAPLVTAQATAAGNQATATTTDANAKGAVKAVTLLATGTQGRIGIVNTAASATGSWGGADTYNGLVITSQLGGVNGADIRINNLALGDTNASVMGDVEILGLMLGKSKIVIMGH